MLALNAMPGKPCCPIAPASTSSESPSGRQTSAADRIEFPLDAKDRDVFPGQFFPF